MYKQDTNKWKMLKFFWKKKGKWFLVKDFCKRFSPCFILYKANTRINEMVHDGYIDVRKHKDTKYSEYKLKDEYIVKEHKQSWMVYAEISL